MKWKLRALFRGVPCWQLPQKRFIVFDSTHQNHLEYTLAKRLNVQKNVISHNESKVVLHNGASAQEERLPICNQRPSAVADAAQAIKWLVSYDNQKRCGAGDIKENVSQKVEFVRDVLERCQAKYLPSLLSTLRPHRSRGSTLLSKKNLNLSGIEEVSLPVSIGIEWENVEKHDTRRTGEMSTDVRRTAAHKRKPTIPVGRPTVASSLFRLFNLELISRCTKRGHADGKVCAIQLTAPEFSHLLSEYQEALKLHGSYHTLSESSRFCSYSEEICEEKGIQHLVYELAGGMGSDSFVLENWRKLNWEAYQILLCQINRFVESSRAFEPLDRELTRESKIGTPTMNSFHNADSKFETSENLGPSGEIPYCQLPHGGQFNSAHERYGAFLRDSRVQNAEIWRGYSMIIRFLLHTRNSVLHDLSHSPTSADLVQKNFCAAWDQCWANSLNGLRSFMWGEIPDISIAFLLTKTQSGPVRDLFRQLGDVVGSHVVQTVDRRLANSRGLTAGHKGERVAIVSVLAYNSAELFWAYNSSTTDQLNGTRFIAPTSKWDVRQHHTPSSSSARKKVSHSSFIAQYHRKFLERYYDLREEALLRVRQTRQYKKVDGNANTKDPEFDSELLSSQLAVALTPVTAEDQLFRKHSDDKYEYKFGNGVYMLRPVKKGILNPIVAGTVSEQVAETLLDIMEQYLHTFCHMKGGYSSLQALQLIADVWHPLPKLINSIRSIEPDAQRPEQPKHSTQQIYEIPGLLIPLITITHDVLKELPHRPSICLRASGAMRINMVLVHLYPQYPFLAHLMLQLHPYVKVSLRRSTIWVADNTKYYCDLCGFSLPEHLSRGQIDPKSGPTSSVENRPTKYDLNTERAVHHSEKVSERSKESGIISVAEVPDDLLSIEELALLLQTYGHAGILTRALVQSAMRWAISTLPSLDYKWALAITYPLAVASSDAALTNELLPLFASTAKKKFQKLPSTKLSDIPLSDKPETVSPVRQKDTKSAAKTFTQNDLSTQHGDKSFLVACYITPAEAQKLTVSLCYIKQLNFQMCRTLLPMLSRNVLDGKFDVSRLCTLIRAITRVDNLQFLKYVHPFLLSSMSFLQKTWTEKSDKAHNTSSGESKTDQFSIKIQLHFPLHVYTPKSIKLVQDLKGRVGVPTVGECIILIQAFSRVRCWDPDVYGSLLAFAHRYLCWQGGICNTALGNCGVQGKATDLKYKTKASDDVKISFVVDNPTSTLSLLSRLLYVFSDAEVYESPYSTDLHMLAASLVCRTYYDEVLPNNSKPRMERIEQPDLTAKLIVQMLHATVRWLDWLSRCHPTLLHTSFRLGPTHESPMSGLCLIQSSIEHLFFELFNKAKSEDITQYLNRYQTTFVLLFNMPASIMEGREIREHLLSEQAVSHHRPSNIGLPNEETCAYQSSMLWKFSHRFLSTLLTLLINSGIPKNEPLPGMAELSSDFHRDVIATLRDLDGRTDPDIMGNFSAGSPSQLGYFTANQRIRFEEPVTGTRYVLDILRSQHPGRDIVLVR